MTLSLRRAGKFLKKCKLGDGDMLLIKSDSELAKEQNLRVLFEAIERIGKLCMLIVVDDFDDVRTMNETDMNKLGWFRLKHVVKNFGVQNDPKNND